MAQKYFQADIKKLESLRIARGWSREQFADKAIVSTRTLDSILAGKQAVLSTLSKLAKALDTPVQTIVDGFEQESPQRPADRRWTITITISGPYDKYDETKDLPEFLTKILSRVGGDELWGAKAAVGSIKIRFYLTGEQNAKLISELEAGNLDDLDIVGMTIDWKASPGEEDSSIDDVPRRRLTPEQRERMRVKPQIDKEDKGEAKTG